MKTRNLAIGIASTLAIGIVVYLVRRNKEEKIMLNKIADEGYETAEDILYPLKSYKRRRWY
jgi:hypothetical protein